VAYLWFLGICYRFGQIQLLICNLEDIAMNSDQSPDTPSTERSKRGCRYFARLGIFGLVSFVVLGFIAYNVTWVLKMTAPKNRNLCCLTPADFGHDYEEISFRGGDDLTMRGWWTPSGNGAAVILLHGYASDRTQMLERADILAREGYGVLLYDQRAHGESEGDYCSFGWADIRDFPGALDFVIQQSDVNRDKIAVLGFSQGGQVALRAAADHPEIGAVIAEEPAFVRVSDVPPSSNFGAKWIAFLYWLDLPGISLRTGEPIPPGILEDLPYIGERPVFYLSSGPLDEQSHPLIAYFHQHTANSIIWNVPEAFHGTIPHDRPEEYAERILTFLENALHPSNGEGGR
jgi:pimeloyl-ACP methyl ester carboxylesterase